MVISYEKKMRSENNSKIFFAYVETQHNAKIMCVPTDNDQEFKMTKFFAAKGIIHQCFYQYTPQQNGVVERKYQHIINVARSLMFQAYLSKKFWADCVQHVTYLINLSPSLVIINKSPCEILFHSHPRYHHLKGFGCLCYQFNLNPKRFKLDYRSSKCIFIGYLS